VRDYAGFNIGFDIYYSTNSEENRKYAELIFANLQKNGLVVEREINQYYCEHDKRFLPDRFIVGACPKCGAGPVRRRLRSVRFDLRAHRYR
jgi:methionyl-tRNA synthetase